MVEYNLRQAARYLGVQPNMLRSLASQGLITKSGANLTFAEEDLRRYRNEHPHHPTIRQSREGFERHIDITYGQESFQQLLDLLSNPSVTYDKIATEFGVSREMVSRWQSFLFPDGPTGRERQRTRTLSKVRDELFENELFSSFYRNAVQYFPPESISFVHRKDKLDEFRKRTVELNGKKVLLGKARRVVYGHGRYLYSGRGYCLNITSEGSDYMFYLLGPNDFLFIPRTELPHKETTFVDSESSKYYRFKNNFNALKTTPQETSND